MSLRGIRLRNFRGFRDTSLELAPLTVLLGPNSAGKSSFGHALAAMAHANREYSTGLATLTPLQRKRDEWPIDLGATLDLRTRDGVGPVCIDLMVDHGTVEFGFGEIHDRPDLVLSSLAHPSDEQNATPLEIQEQTTPRNSEQISAIIRFDKVVGALDPAIRLKRLNEVQWKDGDKDATVLLQGLVLKAVNHHPGGTPRVVSVPVANELTTLFQSLTYLRPNRNPPSRRYTEVIGTVQPIGYSGEFTSGIFHGERANAVSYLRPPNTPKTLQEAQTFPRTWSATEESLEKAVSWWLAHFNLAQNFNTVSLTGSSGEISMRVSLHDKDPHDITEVGFGVSQIIPIVVAGLLQRTDSLFIVDLPEAHLHPRPQGLVADFFCSLALSGRNVLVETHSELFFHRLRLRAAQDARLAEKIAVYFIDAPSHGLCSTPRRVGLDAEGEVRWPEGFLQEAWELETQIQALRAPRS